uniref:Uncharacterized protein n=1 Tax=Fagus sylvatica TaxID=28930 RepID=A0A2N9II97_FAGSY
MWRYRAQYRGVEDALKPLIFFISLSLTPPFTWLTLLKAVTTEVRRCELSGNDKGEAMRRGFVEDFWWVCTGCGGAAWRGLAVGRGFGLRGGSLSLDQSLPQPMDRGGFLVDSGGGLRCGGSGWVTGWLSADLGSEARWLGFWLKVDLDLAWSDHDSMARIITQWLRGSDLEMVLIRDLSSVARWLGSISAHQNIYPTNDRVADRVKRNTGRTAGQTRLISARGTHVRLGAHESECLNFERRMEADLELGSFGGAVNVSEDSCRTWGRMSAWICSIFPRCNFNETFEFVYKRIAQISWLNLAWLVSRLDGSDLGSKAWWLGFWLGDFDLGLAWSDHGSMARRLGGSEAWILKWSWFGISAQWLDGLARSRLMKIKSKKAGHGSSSDAGRVRMTWLHSMIDTWQEEARGACGAC